ncbi:MAG: biotin/lipoyl-containing protein [Gemmatimonadales bacterium]
MIYLVTVGERTVTVDVDGDAVHVDGQVVAVHLEHVPGTPEVRIIIDGVATTLALDGRDGLVWRLVDRGAVREVAVEDERSRQIRLLAGAGRAVDGHAVLRAPMPGLVLQVLVSVGDAIVVGTPLVALEAMKMENELKAARTGVVTEVLVAAGQAVEKGQALLQLG